MFLNYIELLASIRRRVGRRSDVDDAIQDSIWMAECEIQKDCKLTLNDSTATGTTVAGRDYIELPDDCSEPLYLRINDNETGPILVATRDRIHQASVFGSMDGVRARLAFVQGNRLIFGPSPGAVPYTLYYRSGVQHLGPKNEQNRLLTEYPQALLYGALMHLAPVIGDDSRVEMWTSQFTGAKALVRKAEDRLRYGHGPLQQRTDGPTP